jgi:UDP-N-acetylmuramyl-tripeptide synthetase
MPVVRHSNVDAAIDWLRQRGARGLTIDSRRVREGDAFIAWPGSVHDGREHVLGALAAGASACLVEAQGAEAFAFDALPQAERIAAMAGLKPATGELASRFLGEPSTLLDVIATTGTNGKTSTAWWIAQALGLLGRRGAVVGTLGIGEPPNVIPSGLTTPDPVTLQNALRRFADEHFAACAVEASSIGIVEHRLEGTRIGVALFTNFTQDHLDYHGSMQAYWAAKARLFAWPGLRAAVVNIDDEHGEVLARQIGGGLDVWTYGVQRAARLRALQVGYDASGLAFDVQEVGEQEIPVRSVMIGAYNVANLLAVIGALRALGLPLADIAAVIPRLTPVPGRMQRIGSVGAGPQVIVDYAHTPDALEQALLALQPFARERGGRLWCVCGCGGSRDATKRPLMGAIAERLADRVVLTSDNPRDEAPAFILSQILAGVVGHDDVDVIEDRRAAIEHAVSSAEENDVVLLAGKGHEDYQEVGGLRHPFSDVVEAQVALARRAGKSAA